MTIREHLAVTRFEALKYRLRLSFFFLFCALFALMVGYASGLVVATVLGIDKNLCSGLGMGLGVAILFEDSIRRHPWIATGLIGGLTLLYCVVTAFYFW